MGRCQLHISKYVKKSQQALKLKMGGFSEQHNGDWERFDKITKTFTQFYARECTVT
jgi:hypothetical protein